MARVLLVEDDDAIRTSLSKSLTAAGHVVTALATGAEAVAKAARERPEVVLLDLGLPDLGESGSVLLIEPHSLTRPGDRGSERRLDACCGQHSRADGADSHDATDRGSPH